MTERQGGSHEGLVSPVKGLMGSCWRIRLVAGSTLENELSWVTWEIGDLQICSDWSALLETVVIV